MYSHFKQDASHNILEEYLRKFDVVKDENRKKKKNDTNVTKSHKHTYTTYINRKIRNTIFNIVQPINVNYGVHQLPFINQNEMNVKEDSNDDARCILRKNAGMLLSQILNPLNISYDFFSLV